MNLLVNGMAANGTYEQSNGTLQLIFKIYNCWWQWWNT